MVDFEQGKSVMGEYVEKFENQFIVADSCSEIVLEEEPLFDEYPVYDDYPDVEEELIFDEGLVIGDGSSYPEIIEETEQGCDEYPVYDEEILPERHVFDEMPEPDSVPWGKLSIFCLYNVCLKDVMVFTRVGFDPVSISHIFGRTCYLPVLEMILEGHCLEWNSGVSSPFPQHPDYEQVTWFEGITLELEMNWDGNPNMVLGVKTRLAVGLPVQVKNIAFTGVFRLIFRPLVHAFPCFGAVSFSIKKKKMINFTLKVVGGDISDIPDVAYALESTIHDTVEDSITWSVRQVISIVPGNYSNLELKPMGTLEEKLVQAHGLTNKDVIGKSDPFAKIYMRPLSSSMKTSKFIDSDLNPVWNEHFDFVVEETPTQHLTVKIYDYDGLHVSELIGGAQVKLSEQVKAFVIICFTLSGRATSVANYMGKVMKKCGIETSSGTVIHKNPVRGQLEQLETVFNRYPHIPGELFVTACPVCSIHYNCRTCIKRVKSLSALPVITEPAVSLFYITVLANQCITERFLPDKTLDLVDEIDRAMLQLTMENFSLPSDIVTTSNDRFPKLEGDLDSLTQKQEEFNNIWEREKKVLRTRILFLKAELDKVHQELEVTDIVFAGVIRKRFSTLPKSERDTLVSLAHVLHPTVDGNNMIVIAHAGEPLFVYPTQIGELSDVHTVRGFLNGVMEDCQTIAQVRLHMTVCGMTDKHDGYKSLKFVSVVEIGVISQCWYLSEPIAGFFFMVPTGVGKPEFATSLTNCPFNTTNALVRINNNEYMKNGTIRECGFEDFQTCFCTSYAFKHVPNAITSVCWNWVSELMDITSTLTTGHPLYFKVSHSKLSQQAPADSLVQAAAENLVRAAAAAYNRMTAGFGQLFYSGVTVANELPTTQRIAELRCIMIRLLEDHDDPKFEAFWGLNNVCKTAYYRIGSRDISILVSFYHGKHLHAMNGIFINVFCDFGPEFTEADMTVLLMGARAVLFVIYHIDTTFGGIVTQEVLKACSKLFYSIFQLLYFVFGMEDDGSSELRAIPFKEGGDDADMEHETTHDKLDTTHCSLFRNLVRGLRAECAALGCGCDAANGFEGWMRRSGGWMRRSQVVRWLKFAGLAYWLIGTKMELVVLNRYELYFIVSCLDNLFSPFRYLLLVLCR